MLINEYKFDNYNISIYDTIDDISATIWNSTIASENPSQTHSFLCAVEKSYHLREYRYYIVKNFEHNKDIVGVFFATKDKLDLLDNLPRILARYLCKIRLLFSKFALLNISMIGSYETTGKHWWFNKSTSYEVAMSIIVNAISHEFIESSMIVIRDIDKNCSDFRMYNDYFISKGFNSFNSFPSALIFLGESSWSEHLRKLKSNYRKSLNHTMRQFSLSNFKIEHYTNSNLKNEKFYHLIQELYPLYLNTHFKAKEFKRKVIPLSFFKNLIKKCNIILSTSTDGDGNKVAFIMSIVTNKTIIPFFFGNNNIIYKKINPYIALHFDLLDKYSTNKIEIIDLGITNYAIKQTFGATLINNTIYIKFTNKIINNFLGAAIVRFFDVKQPIKRKILKI